MKIFSYYNVVKKIFSFFFPPLQWRLPVTIVTGFLFGFGLVVLKISNATSYLSDDPKSCMNCHVMTPQYATWEKSSHSKTAVCVDCHIPHDNIIHKFLFKASDGLRHSTIFTFRLEPQVIKIKEAGIDVVQQNCIRCHSNLVEKISIAKNLEIHKNGKLCWDCHREVPHGRVNSLASTPYARVPRLTNISPEWIKKFISQTKKEK